MKVMKTWKTLAGVLLGLLVTTGLLLGSCGQLTAPSSPESRSVTSSVNPPQDIEDWTAIPDYADEGGGGGHCVYGNNIFLAANYNDGSLGYSDDGGNTWSLVDSTDTTFGAGNWIKYLAFIANTFRAVGKGGHFASSADGQEWVAITGGPEGDLYAIAYDGTGTYMVVGDKDAATGYMSIALYQPSSASPWTTVTPPATLSGKLNAVTYIAGSFVLASNGGHITYTTNAAYTSLATPFSVPGGNNGFKMAATGTINNVTSVVITSRYGLAYAYSTNITSSGWSWIDIYPSSSYSTHIWLNCVYFDPIYGRFIVAGQDGGMAYTSDPRSWTIDTDFSWTKGYYKNAYINGITYSTLDEIYLATGGDSSPLAMKADYEREEE